MSPPPEDESQAAARAPLRKSAELSAAGEFSSEERRILLALAHESIASAIERRHLDLTPPSPHFAEARGVFTTLYHGGALRGCVGYVVPTISLYEAVAQTARAAAFEDPRFSPLRRDEVAELEVSLSVLSPLQPVRPEQVEIGRHGLLVKSGSHRGLLLPQVAVEHGWDRIAFLEHTCRKAGLPPNAWLTGATLEAFSAEVFGDREILR